jgi:hypothetical protein
MLLRLDQLTLLLLLVTQGLLLRSLMDNGRFCWYHALHDKATDAFGGKKNIFELIESVPSSRAIDVSSGASIRMLHRLYPSYR